MAWYNEFDLRAAAWLQSLAGGLTPDQLPTFDPKTYQIPVNATSSPGSEVGDSLLDLPESPTTLTPGQQVCHASHSASADHERERPTTDTYFQSSIGLCVSSDLQSSLENRLRQRMDLNGSPEYTLQWRTKAISSGLPVCQLLASARHTKGNASSGVQSYPTPTCNRATYTGENFADNLHEVAVKVTGYPTVRASGASSTTREDFTDSLPEIAVKMGGYPTVLSRDSRTGKVNFEPSMVTTSERLMGYAAISASDAQGSHGGGQGASARTDAQVLTHGEATSKPGQTAPRGALNPDFCRWLMGFPKEWVSYGVSAMQSFRKSPRSSSKSSSELAGRFSNE